MTESPSRMLKILVPSLLLAAQAIGGASQAQLVAKAPAQAPPAINPDLLARRWDARWIVAPGTEPFGFGVYHFRKSIDLTERPQRFVVHVTADNRYQLWVNGERVVWGPARGDLNHWRFETIDLAPHLRAGKNVLAAVVWNYGELAPESQVTWRTGFLLQGDTKAEQAVNTNDTWKAARNPAYAPIPFTSAQLRGYYVVGPGERVDGAKFLWGWETAGYDDTPWAMAAPAVPDGRASGSPRSSQDSPNRWLLVPRTIPLMEERPERMAAVRQAAGVAVPAGFPKTRTPFTVPAGTKARLLIDQAYLTTAYPVLEYSGGAGATIKMGYAEALYTPATANSRPDKGNRNEVDGKEFIGNYDLVVADGGRNRRYSPLWWRTYRYLELYGRDAGGSTGHRRPARHLYRLPVRAEVADRHRLGRPAADSRRWLAHGAPVRPRKLHGLPVLRATAICRRHAHPGPGLALHGRRRAAHEERHRAPERLAHRGRRHDEPGADAAAAVHPAVLAVVDRDGPRLLHVRGRRRVCPRDAAGCPRRPAILRGTTEGQRVARADAVVELRGLDRRVAKRRAAARRRRIECPPRPAVAARVRLGGGPRGGPGLESRRRPSTRQRPRHSCARRSGRSIGTRAGASSPTRPRESSSPSTPTCSPCWRAFPRATTRATS